MSELAIKIGVKDGIPYIIDNPFAIKVEVFDYDVEPKAYDETELSKDKKGRDYIYYEL